MRVFVATTGFLAAILAQPLCAQSVNITADRANSTFTVGQRNFEITRTQDVNATLQGDFAKTSRPCPEFCIQPMVVAPGIEPIGELEVLSFLETEVAAGTGLLIDACRIGLAKARSLLQSMSPSRPSVRKTRIRPTSCAHLAHKKPTVR